MFSFLNLPSFPMNINTLRKYFVPQRYFIFLKCTLCCGRVKSSGETNGNQKSVRLCINGGET